MGARFLLSRVAEVSGDKSCRRGRSLWAGSEGEKKDNPVAIYTCQTSAGPEQEDLSTCPRAKGLRDQRGGRMNEVLCLTARDSG